MKMSSVSSMEKADIVGSVSAAIEEGRGTIFVIFSVIFFARAITAAVSLLFSARAVVFFFVVFFTATAAVFLLFAATFLNFRSRHQTRTMIPISNKKVDVLIVIKACSMISCNSSDAERENAQNVVNASDNEAMLALRSSSSES